MGFKKHIVVYDVIDCLVCALFPLLVTEEMCETLAEVSAMAGMVWNIGLYSFIHRKC
jgi:hypothetical protein